MKNAVIYARYSSDRQNEMSIEGQIEECKRYAEAHDLTVIQNYVDRAQSATSDKRPNFLCMIDDSRNGSFEVILVYQFDRFSRNKNDSGYYKKILADNGVKVISAKEQIATDSSGVITEGLLEVFADYFSKQLSEKVHRGMYQRADQCKYNGGTMTFGYTTDKDGYYIVDASTGPIIKEIFERISTGETAKSVCDDLNRRGIRTVLENEFSKNSLHHLLRNEKYKGIYTFGDTRIPDGMPRLISDELFDEVQDVLGNLSRGHRPAIEDYLLTGKLFCGHCKKPMVGTSGTSASGKTYRYYKCSNAPKKCNKENVKKEYLEKQVLKACRNALTDDIIDETVKTVVEINERDLESSELIRLRNEIKSTENKINKLLNQIEDGLNSSRAANRLSERETELEVLTKQLKLEESKQRKINPEQVRNFMRLLRRGYKNDIEYQKMLIHIFVDSIYLYDDHFTLFLKHSKHRGKTSKHEVTIVEKQLAAKGSTTSDGSVPKPRNLKEVPFFVVFDSEVRHPVF